MERLFKSVKHWCDYDTITTKSGIKRNPTKCYISCTTYDDVVFNAQGATNEQAAAALKLKVEKAGLKILPGDRI